MLEKSYLRNALDNIFNFKLEKIKLSKFKQYAEGKYFPPLELRQSGFETISGTGFGLVASEDISENCFIGEYAADILT